MNSRTDGLKIEVYLDAYHCFDWVGIDTQQEGHILKYHPESAADAFAKVKAFCTSIWPVSGAGARCDVDRKSSPN